MAKVGQAGFDCLNVSHIELVNIVLGPEYIKALPLGKNKDAKDFPNKTERK